MEQILSKLSEIEAVTKSIMDDAARQKQVLSERWSKSSRPLTNSSIRRPNNVSARSGPVWKKKKTHS